MTRTALYRPGVGRTLMINTTEKLLLAQAEGITEYNREHRPEEWPTW